MNMKKIVTTILSVSLLLCCVLLLSACGKNVEEPSGLRLNEDTLVLTWNKISGAKGYQVQITGQEDRVIRTNMLSLESLDPGSYEIRIKSLGDQDETQDSEWVSYQFTREEETGLTYRLINNNTEYQLVGVGKATGDVVMEDVYRGKPVTAIADKALSNCTQLTSFVVGKYVKTIGKNAFARCTAMASISLPDSLTSVGAYAFQSCKALTTIALPAGITNVAPYTFSWCSGLQNVSFAGKLEMVSEYAFSNCSGLLQIQLPDTVTVIGEYAFSDCTKMTGLQLGSGIREIHRYAFYNCAVLESVDFGQNLQNIDDSAFGNCLKLKEIIIPDSCTKLGDNAFRFCMELEFVTLGKGLESVGAKVFTDTKFFNDAEELVVIDGWVIECKNKEIQKIKLPENVYGIADGAFKSCKALMDGTDFKGIKYVGRSAFAYCDAIYDVDFDDALLTIGDYAFNGCKDLKDLYLGKSLQRIGDYAFYGCGKFTGADFDLPNSLTYMGQDAFKGTFVFKANQGPVYIDDWFVGCNNEMGMGLLALEIPVGIRGVANYALNGVPVLAIIVIPDTVEYIGKGAFYQNNMVGQITLSRNLKEIGDYAFYGCGSAWFISNDDTESQGITRIPEGVVSIGRSAFYNCAAMVGLEIPGTVKTIGDYAFYGCINLGESTIQIGESDQFYTGEVILQEGIEHIGVRAFYDCRNLVSIAIPNSVTSMGSRVFYKCAKLTNVTLGTGLKEIPDHTFYNCTKLENVQLNDGIARIGKYAFRGCEALQKLRLPDTVETIDQFAFYNCTGLEEMVIPHSVTTIGNYALRGCTGLRSVVISGSVIEMGKHALHGATKATIYCEAPSVPAYWSERWNSSRRPVIWGVTLSEDQTFVVSFVKGEANPANLSAKVSLTAPVREGYVFAGFQADDGKIYGLDEVKQLPAGTVLTVLWNKKTAQ